MNERLEKWLFQSYWLDPKALATVRMLFSGYYLFILTTRFDWLSQCPDSVFRPTPGLAAWLPGFPAPWVTDGLFALVVIASLLVFLGFQTRRASIAMGLAYFTYFILAQGIGKNDHALLIAVLPILMSFSGWGQAWSMDAARRSGPPQVQAWPMAFLALLIGFLWFTAGFLKVQGGWLRPHSSALLANVISGAVSTGHWSYFAESAIQEWPQGLLEALDWITVAFEMLLLPAAFFPKYFRIAIFAAISFHLATFALMGFDFTSFILCYSPLFAWSGISWRPQEGHSRLARLPQWSVLPIAALFLLLCWPFGSPYQALKATLGLELDHYTALYSILGLWLLCGILGFATLIRKP